jgi:hypothetical protein
MITGDADKYSFNEGDSPKGETLDLSFALGETASIEQQTMMEKMNHIIGAYDKIVESINSKKRN